MVAVHRTEVPPPRTWSDLTAADYTVAVPDPSVAASALGALGWFAQDPGHGLDFYRALQRNGAVQVGTPDDVTAGVAQGLYDAGLTTANSAYAARDFISFVVSEEGQRVLGSAGSYPTRPGVPGKTIPEGAPVVHPDWSTIGSEEDAVLDEYQRVFGG